MLHTFFYNQHLYKQRQAENNKEKKNKNKGKSKQNPEVDLLTFAIWKLYIFFIHVINLK